MPRLPFPSPRPEFEPPAGGEGCETRAGPRPLTVTELSAVVKQVLADALPAPVRVLGEISNFTHRTHCFFSLKDNGATIRCVCFASNVRKLGFIPTDGMAVVATGRVDYYDAQGQLQLYVDKLEPVGQGVLEMQYRALCEELRRLGYFEMARKKPLPVMPRTIAVVTSRSGAALQDVINTGRRRCAGCRLLLYDVRVQGAAAAEAIAAALDALSRSGQALGIDAIILTRGGGSIEDLWAFNERVVADAVFHCALPIVAAIGHETDTTIAELVADHRCATPTQAAMTLVPDRAAVEHQLSQLGHRLALLVRRYVDYQRHRVGKAGQHPAMKRPQRMLQPVRQRLEDLRRRMHRAVPGTVGQAKHRVEALSRQLQSVSPRSVLERGYSYTLGPDGQVLRSPHEVQAGARITSVLAQGTLASTVDGEATASLPPPPRRRVKPPPPDEPGLFM